MHTTQLSMFTINNPEKTKLNLTANQLDIPTAKSVKTVTLEQIRELETKIQRLKE